MKIALIAALALATPAYADQLPNKCVAPSPNDQPCTSLIGTYRIELAPRAKSCVVTKPVKAELKITSEAKRTKKGMVPSFDAKALVRALGLKPAKDDAPELTSALREGVCCMDLHLHGDVKGRRQTVKIRMAAGAKLVGSSAEDRWYEERKDGSSDMCGDEDLDVTVTKL